MITSRSYRKGDWWEGTNEPVVIMLAELPYSNLVAYRRAAEAIDRQRAEESIRLFDEVRAMT